jgi:RNase adaptor protein for sRNA GlmZ degradation
MQGTLVIRIYSFGYHRSGIPPGDPVHGGGFVFDCRGLPNPGREERFRLKSGLDREVIEFLEESPAVTEFLEHTCRLVELTVNEFIRRGFDSLMVSFGCTGGQHRSVFCAEKLTARLVGGGFTVERHHLDKPDFS